MIGRHIVGLEVVLEAVPPASADDVTDLIEAVVDALDEAGYEASVGSTGYGADLTLTVEVVVAGGSLDAFETGVTAINKALSVAGVRDQATDVNATVRALEPA